MATGPSILVGSLCSEWVILVGCFFYWRRHRALLKRVATMCTEPPITAAVIPFTHRNLTMREAHPCGSLPLPK